MKFCSYLCFNDLGNVVPNQILTLIPYIMNHKPQTANADEIMHYPFSTEALRLKFNKVLKALDELNTKDSLSNLKNFEVVLDNTLKRSRLVLQASEIADKQLKQEQLSKALGLSVPMVKKYIYLAKAEAEAEAEAVANFKALNRERLDKGLKVNYGIDAITKHLKGEKVYLSEEEIQAQKDKAENKRSKKQAEAKASTKPKAEAEAAPKPNEANYLFNPILFGFEENCKEDIKLNIIHSPKNTAKPYLITSNVPSFVLRSMFETILRHLGRCEDDLETIKQYETELTDEDLEEIREYEAEYTNFDSDYIRIAR